MDILHKHTGNKGMFYVEEDEEIMAEMTFIMQSKDTMIIEHTEVGEELRGQNVGYQLVRAAAEFARNHSLRIITMCPFAKSVFDKKPELRDVLVDV